MSRQTRQDAERILNIDKHRLDEEWLMQPKLFGQFAFDLAEAKTEFERAKASLELVEAELDREVRLSPEKFDLPEKLTETLIANTVKSRPRYRKAYEGMIEAKHEVGILSAATEACEQRKKALEGLVSLFLADYYSSPKAPDNGREAIGRLERDAAFGRGKKRKGGNSE